MAYTLSQTNQMFDRMGGEDVFFFFFNQTFSSSPSDMPSNVLCARQLPTTAPYTYKLTIGDIAKPCGISYIYIVCVQDSWMESRNQMVAARERSKSESIGVLSSK